MKSRAQRKIARARAELREAKKLAQTSAALEIRLEELEHLRDELDRLPEIGDAAPPELAELLLSFFARASQDEFAAGDMNEIFVRDCAERGRSRAARLYWSNVLGYLLGRSLRLAAVVGFIKKLFVG